MRKLICLFFVVLFLFGCRGDDKRIMIWHSRRPVERQPLRDALEQFRQERYPEWSFDERFYEPEECRTNFIISGLGGSGPALFWGASDNIGPFVDMEVIQPIEPHVSEAFINSFVREPFEANTWHKGHLYQVADEVGNHLCLIYNKDIIPEAPETMNELIALKDRIPPSPDGSKRYVLAWNFVEPFFFIPFLAGYGGWVMDEDFNPTLNNPETVRACQLIYDLRNVHEIIPKEADYEFSNQLFKDGYAAMIINGPWSFSTYTDLDMNIGITRIPMIDETGLWPAPMISSRGYSLNANLEGEKLEIAIELLRYLTSPEIELQFTQLTGAIPSHVDAFDSEIVRQNEILQSSLYQLQVGRQMPVVTELRWIWDAMRPAYQAVFTGQMKPEQAAEEMQKLAEKLIRESK